MLWLGNSLELWYYTAVILMVGSLKNPAIAVDAISIWLVFFSSSLLSLWKDHNYDIRFCLVYSFAKQACVLIFPNFCVYDSMNLQLWTLMIALGFNAAVRLAVLSHSNIREHSDTNLKIYL